MGFNEEKSLASQLILLNTTGALLNKKRNNEG